MTTHTHAPSLQHNRRFMLWPSSLAPPVSARMNPHRPSSGSDDHGLDKLDGSHGQVSSAAACFVSRAHWLSCAAFHPPANTTPHRCALWYQRELAGGITIQPWNIEACPPL